MKSVAHRTVAIVAVVLSLTASTALAQGPALKTVAF
jgi:hypothetical protein